MKKKDGLKKIGQSTQAENILSVLVFLSFFHQEQPHTLKILSIRHLYHIPWVCSIFLTNGCLKLDAVWLICALYVLYCHFRSGDIYNSLSRWVLQTLSAICNFVFHHVLCCVCKFCFYDTYFAIKNIHFELIEHFCFKT